jgi:hypothetical protein
MSQPAASLGPFKRTSGVLPIKSNVEVSMFMAAIVSRVVGRPQPGVAQRAVFGAPRRTHDVARAAEWELGIDILYHIV